MEKGRVWRKMREGEGGKGEGKKKGRKGGRKGNGQVSNWNR